MGERVRNVPIGAQFILKRTGDDYKPLGHDCDRAAWERVASLWRK